MRLKAWDLTIERGGRRVIAGLRLRRLRAPR